MPTSTDALHNLLAQFERTGEDTNTLEQLAFALRPILRLALRKGKGLPQVLHWIKRTKATLADRSSNWTGENLETLADRYASLLAQALLRVWQDPDDRRGTASETIRQ